MFCISFDTERSAHLTITSVSIFDDHPTFPIPPFELILNSPSKAATSQENGSGFEDAFLVSTAICFVGWGDGLGGLVASIVWIGWLAWTTSNFESICGTSGIPACAAVGVVGLGAESIRGVVRIAAVRTTAPTNIITKIEIRVLSVSFLKKKNAKIENAIMIKAIIPRWLPAAALIISDQLGWSAFI